MNDKIKGAPAVLETVEQRVQAGLVANVAGQHDIAAELSGQRIDPLFQRITLIGERQFRPGLGQGPGNAPGDGFVIGKAHDQPTLALHQSVFHGHRTFAFYITAYL